MHQSIRILHLEDEAADAALVEAMLKSAGMVCQITRAQSGDAFADALRQSEYDIILADFRLPAYDGMSALRLAQQLARDVPFIFVSGVMSEDAAIEGLTQGATDYVLKDKLTRLEPAVKRALLDAENRHELKRAEEALRESEERLRLTLEAIDDGLWDWNITTDNAVFSPRWYSMLGYEPYELAQNYDSWKSLVHPEDIDRAEREINAHIASGEGCAIEIRMLTKAGSWRWVLTRGRVVERDADGHPIRMVGTHSDITDRKRAEESLPESQQMLKLVLDTIPARVFWKNLDSNYLGCNRPFVLDAGLQSPEEIIGRNDFEMGCAVNMASVSPRASSHSR
jgi:PAS domain S-box-containing protein